jgi:hypothetical protein
MSVFQWHRRSRHGWVKVWFMVDSGCGKSASPSSLAPNVEVRPSAASRRGTEFTTANGARIKAQGEKSVKVELLSGLPCSLRFEICEISKPLLSVADLNDKKVGVWFGPDDAALYLADGSVQPLERHGGTFWLCAWVEPGQGGVLEEAQALGLASTTLPTHVRTDCNVMDKVNKIEEKKDAVETSVFQYWHEKARKKQRDLLVAGFQRQGLQSL